MIETYLLEQLTAFARYGTLRAASQALHLTQPSLSRSMQKLEADLGVPLFERRKNRIVLNENGLLAAEYANRILNLCSDMKDHVVRQERSRHAVSIGTSGPGPLFSYFPVFTGLYPDRTVISEVKPEPLLLEGLREKTYNFVFLTHKEEAPDLFCRYCLTEELYACLTPEHPLAGRESISPAELNGEDFIIISEIGIWDQVIRSLMPDSSFFQQESMVNLDSIVKRSSLSTLASNQTYLLNGGKWPSNRVAIPVSDPACRIPFYAVCSKSDLELFRPFFSWLDRS